MNLKFYAFAESNIPALADRIPGAIYYTDQGNQYIVKADGNLLKVADIEKGFVDEADLLSKNPARLGKLYLTDDNNLFFYSGTDYKRITKENEIQDGYLDKTDLTTKNPAKSNTIYITDDDRLYFYTGTEYKQVGLDRQLYSGYLDKAALVLANPAIENVLYLTSDGNIYYYKNYDYTQLSKDRLRTKKEKLTYNENGEITKLEYSLDNYVTILLEKLYEYNPVDGSIIKETINDYENEEKIINNFSYNETGNIVEIDTVYSAL